MVLEIKFIGIILILISAAAIGCIFGEKAKREIKVLESLNRCLMLFEGEIRYSGTTIRDICERLSGSGEIWTDFFRYISDELSCDAISGNIGMIWERGISLSDVSKALNDEDKCELIRFGRELGSGDRESELARINLYMDYIKNRLSYLEDNINERVRLCRLLGVTAGVFITILIV